MEMTGDAVHETEFINEIASREILERHGVRFNRVIVARGDDEVRAAASLIDARLVVKVVSDAIVHKSDIGAVLTDVDGPDAAVEASQLVLARSRAAAPGEHIDAVSIQEMISRGVAEIFIGARRSSTFGPLITVGMGGVLVELLGDVSTALAPVTVSEARRLLEELRLFPLLAGYRGREEADLDALCEQISAVSRVLDEETDVEEIDVNPVIVRGSGAFAVDARVLRRTEVSR